MTEVDAIAYLEGAWDSLLWGNLREGRYDTHAADDFLANLRTISVPPEATHINARFVTLVWYLPLFVRWQRERIAEAGGDADAYLRFENGVEDEVSRILGIP